MYFFTKFKPDIKPKIENLQDELHQLESKHVKVQTFFKVLEWQNMQNQTISESYTNDKKAKYCNIPNYVPKSVKNFYEKLYIKQTIIKSVTSVLSSKISNRKPQMNNFNLEWIKFFL